MNTKTKTGGVLVRAMWLLVLMSLITGLIYTMAVMGLGQLLFPSQANGSLLSQNGKVVGSALLGQQFTDDGHLWGRVMQYDVGTFTDENGAPAAYAWPSNLSPASPAYEALVAERVEKLRASNPDRAGEPVPVDLVTCSGSGLDPHISPAAAEYQVPRIAKATGKSEDEIRETIRQYTEGRLLGVFGEPRVNVLKVNLALDGMLS